MINLKTILVVIAKEILDILRDKRTVIVMFIVPILIGPVLMVGFTSLSKQSQQKASEQKLKIAYKGKTPVIDKSLSATTTEWIESEDIPKTLEDKKADIGLDMSDIKKIKIIYDSTQTFFGVYLTRLKQDIIKPSVDKWVKETMKQLGIEESQLEPFKLEEVNIAPKEKQAGFSLGMLFGYLITLTVFMNGMLAAIDLTAGEKERRTIETLLISPASRESIVLGKVITVAIAAFISGLLELFGFFFSFKFGGMDEFASASLGISQILLLTLILIPVSVMAGAILVSICIFAKSYKEAQSYLSPISLVIVFATMINFLPDVEPTSYFSFVPILNISMFIESIFRGNLSTVYVLINILVNVVYATIAFVIAVRIFKKESVLFRT